MAMLNRLLIYISAAALLAVCGPALAGDGQPSPWQMGFQKAASPIMEQITSFHDFVNIKAGFLKDVPHGEVVGMRHGPEA